jgi:hypothetical protein
MSRIRKPLPDLILDCFEPVKPYIEHDPIEKEELISRVAGRVEQHVLNFLKRFSFVEISKQDDGQLIVI